MSFGARLRAVMKHGGLTAADLHHWFGRPRPTVRTWITLDHEPRGPSGELARERLHTLERVLQESNLFPPPRTLSAQERPRYIVQVRDGLERTRVPAKSAA